MNFLRVLPPLLLIEGLAFAGPQDYWQQAVHYVMKVRLDPELHQVSGSSNIVYTNHSPDSLRMFYLILYPNAFQVGSVKHRESQQVYGTGNISADNPSGIDVTQLTLTGPSGAATSDFKVEDTILAIRLPEPLASGGQVSLAMDWVHTVREHNGRAGWRGDQYDLAQWYPKVVVYDERGWNNEPFHRIGEFYGEFSTFDVTIDVPYRYVIGATGVVTEGDPGWELARVDTSLNFDAWAGNYKIERDSLLAGTEEQRRTVTFHAEQVHDFAWIASPDFVYEGGQWNGIALHVLYNLGVGNKWTRKVAARSIRALEWLTTNFGAYPYPQVTVTHGLLSGGMEYPMLVMNGREGEGLIVHEIGHIWFYGILGNNEMEEAWLDEGFTTFQTRWYLTHRYGPSGRQRDPESSTWWERHLKLTPSLARTQWWVAAFQTGGHNEPIATASYRTLSAVAYHVNAYPKPSLMLESLQYLLGEAVFEAGMQNYYDKWALKHPTEDRFRREMEAASGHELDWFFDQWLHTSGYVDYALKKWRQRPAGDGFQVEVTLE
ncbi:MAG: M1 family metallopeptidase, partial [Candidatus Neomarinimicrobiota bacterium]